MVDCARAMAAGVWQLNGKAGVSCFTGLAFFVLVACLPAFAAAQVPTLEQYVPDSLRTEAVTDTLPGDSLAAGQPLGFAVSGDSLDAPVAYESTDSMRIDMVNQLIHLYGDAKVTYAEITLKAAHIVLSWDNSVVEAEPMPDSLGRPAGLPEFSDGTQLFTADRMRYNFKTRKGIVYDAVTSQEDIIVRGGRSKFISGAFADTDSTRADVIYSEGGIFTTCTDEHPHFGIRTSRAKVIPNKVAILGPSYLEIMGIPTPLVLPFGFFPLKQGRSTGLLFPSDYEYSPQWGYGLRDFGWFFPLGEHFNLSLTGTYYLKGTWGAAANVSYRKRYKYNGGFNLAYDKRRIEDNEGFVTFQPSFNLRWNHNQDRAAHPTASFGGSVNFQTNNFQQRVFNDYQSVSRNVINSNLNFRKTWTDKPFSLTAGLSHNQNNQTRIITVNFPQVQFQTQTLYPFRRQERIGKERWYEKATFRYTNELRGTFTGPDSTFFDTETLVEKSQYGFRHDATTGVSFKVLKYFSLNPSATYREVYYGKALSRTFDPLRGVEVDTTIDVNTGELVIDTTDFGTIIESLDPGIKSFRTFNAGASLTTQIYGTANFRLGPLRGLRHVVKPTISVGFQPDYSGNLVSVPDTLDPFNRDADIFYSPFQGQIFGAPPTSEGQFSASYSINNVFQAKVYSRKDSTERNIKLFDNFNINGNYNFQLDSLKWSPVGVRANTQFFKGLTRISGQATFDPYETIFDAEKRRAVRRDITTLQNSQTPFKLTRLSGTVSTNLTVRKIRELFQGAEEEVVSDIEEERRKQDEESRTLFEETDLLSLFENFSISHNLRFDVNRGYSADDNGFPVDSLPFRLVANSIELRGRIQLTENWNVDIGSIGYDFISKSITYPFLSLARDLHCWEMRFSWAPTRNFYSFSISVKPGTLDFLNIPYQRNNVDGRRLFGT